jgi:hypothetical protein
MCVSSKDMAIMRRSCAVNKNGKGTERQIKRSKQSSLRAHLASFFFLLMLCCCCCCFSRLPYLSFCLSLSLSSPRCCFGGLRLVASVPFLWTYPPLPSLILYSVHIHTPKPPTTQTHNAATPPRFFPLSPHPPVKPHHRHADVVVHPAPLPAAWQPFQRAGGHAVQGCYACERLLHQRFARGLGARGGAVGWWWWWWWCVDVDSVWGGTRVVVVVVVCLCGVFLVCVVVVLLLLLGCYCFVRPTKPPPPNWINSSKPRSRSHYSPLLLW